MENYHVPHSVTFDGKNSWDDWHLIPVVRPSFVPPTLNTKYIEIPGSSGSLDISESLTGYPTYKNREGSLEFLVANGFKPWEELYQEISSYLNGRIIQAYLEDDPDYYYEGRFTVTEWDSSSPPWSKITISYIVDPYKWRKHSSTYSWLWDPFVFATDTTFVSPFDDFRVDAANWSRKTFKMEDFGDAPVCPTFIIKSTDKKGMDAKYINTTLGISIPQVHLPDGTTEVYDFIFYGRSNYELYFKGHGRISMEFRIGRLG